MFSTNRQKPSDLQKECDDLFEELQKQKDYFSKEKYLKLYLAKLAKLEKKLNKNQKRLIVTGGYNR